MDKSKEIRAKEFESYIMNWYLKEHSISLSHFTTLKEQIHIGENRQGIEIKNDQKLSTTGNIYISVKRVYDYGKEYPSGIFKNQSWLYVIGDYNMHWVFSIKHLKQYYTSANPKLIKGFKTLKDGQEYGFLLNAKNADYICTEKYSKQTVLL